MSARKQSSAARVYRLSAREIETWDGAPDDEAPARCEIRRSAINVYPDAASIELRAPDGSHLGTV